MQCNSTPDQDNDEVDEYMMLWNSLTPSAAAAADTLSSLQELHARMEPLLIFTIDGANFLDVADPKWEVVAAVMERNGQQHLVRKNKHGRKRKHGSQQQTFHACPESLPSVIRCL